MRIVSLVPSATETIVSWGITPLACTRFCKQDHITTVGGTKDPNIAEIIALKPDLVVMDREENRIEDFESLTRAGIEVHTLHIQSIYDLDSQLSLLAERLGSKWRACEFGDPTVGTLRAFVPIWRNPWIALGQSTYGGSLLHHLGINLVPTVPDKYPLTTITEVQALSPRVVLAPSEPYPFTKRQLPELQKIASVYLLDGQDLFWWGVRTQSAMARLKKLIDQVLTDVST